MPFRLIQFIHEERLTFSSLSLQFNRCFTTNVRCHVVSLLTSAIIGFAVGCALHVVYKESPPLYLDVIALNTSSVTAAILTSVWTWKEFGVSSASRQVSEDKVRTKESSNLLARQEGARSEILGHLCFDIDVDTEWDTLPSDIREVIVSRVLGKPVRVSKKFKEWMDYRKIDQEEIDQRLNVLLEAYRHEMNASGASFPCQLSRGIADIATQTLRNRLCFVGYGEDSSSLGGTPLES